MASISSRPQCVNSCRVGAEFGWVSEIHSHLMITRAHFTNDFSIVIQILIQVVVKWLLWNCAHGMPAVLLWYVQNCVAIWFPTMKLYIYIYIKFHRQWQWKNRSWNGPLGMAAFINLDTDFVWWSHFFLKRDYEANWSNSLETMD